MIDEKVNIIINEIRDELKSLYPDFRGIYLFGSHARGDANDDSDIDIAIIFDREIDWRFKSQVRNLVSIKETKHDSLIDSIILNSYDIVNPKELLIYELNSKGILYGA